jgi:hypothetical protein
VVELDALEKRCVARYRGFESLPLRQERSGRAKCAAISLLDEKDLNRDSIIKATRRSLLRAWLQNICAKAL